jgi:hypothetical protein
MMGPGGSLGVVYSTLMGWATYIYIFLGCGLF